jgi:hypothetical protein
MINRLDGSKNEYLGEKEIAKGAPRLPGVFTTERLLTDNRGDFPFGGHRLSSLYRIFENAALPLTERYFSASFSLKYSNSTLQGVTTPGALA